jgi:hypothetical protein
MPHSSSRFFRVAASPSVLRSSALRPVLRGNFPEFRNPGGVWCVSATVEGTARDFIRHLIRQKLQDGRLPRGTAPRAFGRPGNWQKCEACEQPMAKAQLKMELYPQTHDRKAVRLHGDCYIVWNEERRALES